MLDDAAIEALIEAGYDPMLGARPLKRVVSKSVENIVAKATLRGDIKSGDILDISAEDIKAELQ